MAINYANSMSIIQGTEKSFSKHENDTGKFPFSKFKGECAKRSLLEQTYAKLIIEEGSRSNSLCDSQGPVYPLIKTSSWLIS